MDITKRDVIAFAVGVAFAVVSIGILSLVQ